MYSFLIYINLLYFTLQKVQTAIFCDNYIREIYLINETTKKEKVIANGSEHYWAEPYYYNNLEADPGDLIKIKCYNSEGWSFGAGCFLINNICRCYMFHDDYNKGYTNELGPHPGKVTFENNIQCNIDVYWINIFNIPGDYYYYHYIPLDANAITCMNDKILTVPINYEYSIKFSDFIESSFKVTNLKISIIENYKYFTFNNNKLTQNDKFNISNNLIFFHNKNEKIKIKFKNYGVVLDNNKICELNIRVCYDTCLECNDIDGNTTNHQCSKCKNEFYFIENTNNCKTKDQMKDTNYYFSEKKNMFIKCYNDCLTCYDSGDINDMKCKICEQSKYFAEPNNCIDNIENYYYSEENQKYIKCYKTCFGCNKGSNEKYHGCKQCLKDDKGNYIYHFIYNEDGKCISKDEKPSNTYLDISSNTYKLCYERCSKCDSEGNNKNNNCFECLKDNKGNYIYHFIYNEKGKCLLESEINELLYLDNSDNTYKLCPEGTKKIENNKCIKSNLKLYIIIIIILIIIIIIIIIIVFYFIRIIKKKKSKFNIEIESNDMIELMR